MGWILVPSLVSLRNELNQFAPGRDKTTDGSIGDAAHAAQPSDHNADETGTPERYDSDNVDEVHAIDVDKDLRKSGWNMTRVVRLIADRHRRGLDNRLEYIIWDRQIASRGSGWAWVYYDGSNPHTDHAHFSARYGSGSGTGNPENITAPWGLLDEEDDDFMGLFKDLDEYKAYQVSLIQNQVPDAMNKALADGGKVRDNMVAVVGDGVREGQWDAIHAIRRDAVYTAATPQRQGEMRNAMDLSKIMLREALVRILNAKEGDVDATNDLMAQTALKDMVKEAVQELIAEGKLKA